MVMMNNSVTRKFVPWDINKKQLTESVYVSVYNVCMQIHAFIISGRLCSSVVVMLRRTVIVSTFYKARVQ
jgi:hypothetical protein